MDELKLLGAVLAAPEPTTEAFDRSRHRLRNSMRGAPAKRRHPKRWIAAGAGLATVAAAVAVVVSDRSGPGSGPVKEPVLSGQQVMLAAAVTAESRPATSGTYWHTRSVEHLGKVSLARETWIRRDGRTWLSAAPGLVSRVEPHPILPSTKLGYAQVQRLPTDPGRLKAALLRSSSFPQGTEQERQLAGVNVLQSVLIDAPAPPKVRAAAFRALAALPGIANLGKTTGGYRLKISYMSGTGRGVDGTETIVVDPKSTQVRVEGWAGFGDGGLPVGPSQSTSGWTDRLSGRLVPWTKQEPYIAEENRRLNGQDH